MKSLTMKALTILSVVALAACAPSQYAPPNAPVQKEQSITVNKSFDEVWRTLVAHTGTGSFGVDKIEKDSGLMILFFVSKNPEELITGGNIVYSNKPVPLLGLADTKNPVGAFTGDYAVFLDKFYKGHLSGPMNIVVQPISAKSTSVSVYISYTFDTKSGFWRFKTGTCDTKLGPPVDPVSGKSQSRTICPTHKAEQDILDLFK